MTEQTTPAIADILRSALERGREHACRSVRLLAEGVEIVDGLGRTRELTSGGAARPTDVEALRQLLSSQEYRNWNTYGARAEVEREIPGLGLWVVASDEADGIVLKPKKAFPATLDQVFSVDAEALASFRRSYAAGGADVFAAVEGDTRARDLAVAMAAERNLAGLPTTLDVDYLGPERPGYDRWPQTLAAWKGRTNAFDDLATVAAPRWTISQATETEGAKGFFEPSASIGTNVVVMGASAHAAQRFARAEKQVADRVRPTAVLAVFLQKSAPVGRLVLAPGYRAAAAASPIATETPWAVLAKRKAARDAARPKAEKTWHQTTEAVAEAFVARKAPRGYVTGKSLFFHGPVAFSVSDGNPIAAFVDTKGGEPVLLYGRSRGMAGSGTVSSAQGDVSQAAGQNFRRFDVGDLSSVLTLGGKRLYAIALRMRHDKDEDSHPANCAVDPAGMRKYLEERHEAAIRELQDANKTTFATHRKANAYAQLGRLAEMATTLSEAFGFEAPKMADPAEMDREYSAAREAARERERMLAERRKAAEAEQGAAAPRM